MGEGGVCQKVTLVYEPIYKMGDKGEGGVKNFNKWVTLYMNGPKTIFILFSF